MAIKNDTAKATIYLNGQQAEAALDGLKNKAKQLQAELKAAQKAGDQIKMTKAEKELRQVESAIKSVRKETYDYEKVLRNLNGASLNDLRKALRTIDIQMQKMDRTDPGFKKLQEQSKLLRNEINSVNAEMRSQESTLYRIAQGFNDYSQMVMAGAAALAGLSLAAKGAIDVFSEHDDKLSDVQKTTGLTKEEVIALNEELSKLDTRTKQMDLLDLSRIGGKLEIRDVEELEGFVSAADKIGVALTEDLGGDIEESIRQIGKLVDLFNVKEEFGIEKGLTKVGSTINSLGATSTASEEYMVEFTKRLGGIAPAAQISIANVLGLAATLDNLGQSAEVGGTIFNQMIPKMFKEPALFASMAKIEVGEFTKLLQTDANEALIKVMEGVKGNNASLGTMAQRLDDMGLDGARAIGVLSVLAQNTELLRDRQAFANEEFAKGISLQNEFNLKNENAMAKREKASKSFMEMARILGEKLTPAYTSIISRSKMVMVMVSEMIDFFTKYGRAMIVTAASIVGYTVAIKVAASWTKIQAAATATARLAAKAYGTIKQILTGQITLATAAQKGWNMAIKANPIGLLIGLISGAIVWLIQWNNRTGKVSQAFRKVRDEIVEVRNWFIELYNASMPVRAVIETLVAVMKTGFEAVKFQLKGLWESMKFGGNLMKAVLTFDMEGVKTAYKQLTDNLKKDALESSKAVGETWTNAFQKTARGYIMPNMKITGIGEDLESEQSAVKKRQKSEFPDEEEIQTPNNGKGEEKDKKKALKASDGKDYLKLEEEKLFQQLKEYSSKYGNKDEQESDPGFDYAIEKHMETMEGQLALVNAQYKNGVIAEQEYQDKITDIYRKAAENRKELSEEEFEKRAALVQLASDLITSLMEYELNAAGDNEEKKNQVRKKYANIQFVSALAGIIVNTSGAVMKALSDLGPIAGAIAAGLIIASGGVQAGIAMGQRKKMIEGTGYSEGGFTREGDKNEPVGVVHAGEWIAPQSMVKSPVTGPMIQVFEQIRKSGAIQPISIPAYNTSKSFATGGFTPEGSNPIPVSIGINEESASKLLESIERLMKWQPKVYTEAIKKDLETLDTIEKSRGL